MRNDTRSRLITLGGALPGEHIARLRDEHTPPAGFRRAAAALATLVLAEALRDLEPVEATVRTPDRKSVV